MNLTILIMILQIMARGTIFVQLCLRFQPFKIYVGKYGNVICNGLIVNVLLQE